MFKVIKYHSPLRIKQNYTKLPKIIKKINDEESIHRSVRRTKSVIKDYILNNDFDLFVTFTFNPEKVNRYDFSHCSAKMQSWLGRIRSYSNSINGDFRYIIVPEYHKDGAIHFHALLGDYPKLLKKTKVIKNNKLVYNLTSYRYGWTSAQKIDQLGHEIYGYLTKYITKEMILLFGRKRYWASRNLIKPEIYHNQIDELSLEDKLIVQNLEYENNYCKIYKIPKFE